MEYGGIAKLYVLPPNALIYRAFGGFLYMRRFDTEDIFKKKLDRLLNFFPSVTILMSGI